MARINITPEHMHQVANEFKQSSQQSQELVSRLQNTINNLHGEWDGLTQQRFYQEFQQWSTQMRQFVDLLNGIGQQLDAVANRFATADQA